MNAKRTNRAGANRRRRSSTLLRPRRVVVVGSDEHAGFVAAAVARAGGDVVLVDPLSFPTRDFVTWQNDELHWQHTCVSDARVVFIKALPLALPTPAPEELRRQSFDAWLDRYASAQERHGMLSGALRALAARGCLLVNSLYAVDLHMMKPLQVALLRRKGLPVPDTLVTNDPGAVRRFASIHDDVIYKPIAGGAHAQALCVDDCADARLRCLRDCPALFQERIMGREYRAYVVAGEVVGAYETPVDDVVDARLNVARAKPVTLPANGAALAVKVTQALDLVFSAVEMRLTDAGRWVCIEANPTPAISFYDDPHDGVVIRSLAAFLVRHA